MRNPTRGDESSDRAEFIPMLTPRADGVKADDWRCPTQGDGRSRERAWQIRSGMIINASDMNNAVNRPAATPPPNLTEPR